jgi:hypothetical protein
MNWKKILKIGVLAGIVFGIVLFIGGAITARIVYGAQMAPEGKFDESQMNAFYFIWTKIMIGIFFGILFLYFYEKLSVVKRIEGALEGLKYGFFFWFIISLWNLSHPLVYESIWNRDQLFWLLYTLWGFLAFGATTGYLYRRRTTKKSK